MHFYSVHQSTSRNPQTPKKLGFAIWLGLPLHLPVSKKLAVNDALIFLMYYLAAYIQEKKICPFPIYSILFHTYWHFTLKSQYIFIFGRIACNFSTGLLKFFLSVLRKIRKNIYPKLIISGNTMFRYPILKIYLNQSYHLVWRFLRKIGK